MKVCKLKPFFLMCKEKHFCRLFFSATWYSCHTEAIGALQLVVKQQKIDPVVE